LEDAFIRLTGHTIRAEEASASDRLRNFAKVWGGGPGRGGGK
jgi:hypothetical protein